MAWQARPLGQEQSINNASIRITNGVEQCPREGAIRDVLKARDQQKISVGFSSPDPPTAHSTVTTPTYHYDSKPSSFIIRLGRSTIIIWTIYLWRSRSHNTTQLRAELRSHTALQEIVMESNGLKNSNRLYATNKRPYYVAKYYRPVVVPDTVT